MAGRRDLDRDAQGQRLHRPVRLVAKVLAPQLVKAASGLLKRKMLFGSDYPVINPDRWIKDFDDLDIKPDVRPLILKENAIRVLGLGR